jgi:hypothetical protein
MGDRRFVGILPDMRLGLCTSGEVSRGKRGDECCTYLEENMMTLVAK